jgi:hypothetical protein
MIGDPGPTRLLMMLLMMVEVLKEMCVYLEDGDQSPQK